MINSTNNIELRDTKNLQNSAEKSQNLLESVTGKIGNSDSAKKSLFEETLTYFKLFLTEIRYQDPFNTVETKDMTEQMLNIHLAEQSINTNKNLEKLIEISNNNNQASYIGKEVRSFKLNVSAKAKLENSELVQQFKLAEDSDNVNIMIRTEDNKIVKTQKISGKMGINNFIWDGRDNYDNQLKDGKYIIDIAASGQKGKFIDTEIALGGKVITSFKDGKEIKLILDNGEMINIDDVVTIAAGEEIGEFREASLKDTLENMNKYLQNFHHNK